MLAVSDEVDDALLADPSAARGVELILACGDLPMEYLGSLMDCLEVPLVFVPGNHDPDLSGYRISRAGRADERQSRGGGQHDGNSELDNRFHLSSVGLGGR